jgi:hypothetical protein
MRIIYFPPMLVNVDEKIIILIGCLVYTISQHRRLVYSGMHHVQGHTYLSNWRGIYRN